MRYRSRYPSVPHQAIVAWFGPDESKRYYARRSRRRLVSLPELVEMAGITQEELPPTTFSGFDWTELLDAFGFEHTDEDYDDLNTLTEYLTSKLREQDCAEVAKTLRSFLEALATKDTTYGPLWRGLIAIKCDEAFVQMSIKLIGDMWI